MPWAMTNSLASTRGPVEFTLPTASGFTASDCMTWSGQSNNGSAWNLTVPCTKFRSVVFVKNFVTQAASMSIPSIFKLVVGDNGVFSNSVCVDTKVLDQQTQSFNVATGEMQTFLLTGQLVDRPRQFASVHFVGASINGALAVASWDVWLDATP